MILYLDASALVKLYVDEAGAGEVAELVDGASVLGTALITVVEVAGAIARAARRQIIGRDDAEASLRMFLEQWGSLHRLPVTESIARRAADVAWMFGLRGCDAIHLACSVAWKEMTGEAVTVATYDRELWGAARGSGSAVWPAAPE